MRQGRLWALMMFATMANSNVMDVSDLQIQVDQRPRNVASPALHRFQAASQADGHTRRTRHGERILVGLTPRKLGKFGQWPSGNI